MPSSRKGRGQKKIQRRPVPVPTEFVARLRPAIEYKAADASVLTKPSGDPWKKADHSRLFRRAAAAAGVDPAESHDLRPAAHQHRTPNPGSSANAGDRRQSRHQRCDAGAHLQSIHRRPRRRVSAAGVARHVGAADGQHGMQLEELMSVRNFRLEGVGGAQRNRLLGIAPDIEDAARPPFRLPAGPARNGIAGPEIEP
jgi:hypothetical protein